MRVGGTSSLSVGSLSGPSDSFGINRSPSDSDLEQFLLLVDHHLIDLCDELIGDLLKVLLGSLEVIFRHVAFLLKTFHLFLGVPPYVPNSHPPVLRTLLDDLDELPSSVLCQRGEGKPNDGSVI